MSKLFYYGNEQVSEQLSHLQKKVIEGTAVYQNNVDDTYWKIREIDSMYVGKVSQILVKQPEPETGSLVCLLLTLEDNYDIVAAALILKENEICFGIDYRRKLLEEIEKIDISRLNKDQKNRLKNIIVLSELHHGENRRVVLNKQYDIIKADSNYFMDIARKADTILRQLKPNAFEKFITFTKKLSSGK